MIGRLKLSQHAARRMLEYRVSEEEIRLALVSGHVIERYPEDTPYPSRLVLAWSGNRPLHVVAADIPEGQETIVITVYEADPARWEGDFRTRRSR